MKKFKTLAALAITVMATFSSCCRSRYEVWEDTKTCGRYLGKGVRSFFGQHVDSNEYAKYCKQWEDDGSIASSASYQDEFSPLSDTESFQSLSMRDYPQAQASPGDPGSLIPGVEAFTDPSGELAKLFSKIHFETDHYTIKGSENVATLRAIAAYMATHPKMYVFIAGHADERGAAAYNLSLGSKRANSVRAFLIDNGVNADHLFTISYGLERPIALSHDERAWSQNRRAEFKLYGR